LKNSNIKYLITIIIFLLLSILSLGIYYTYPFIKEQAKEYEYNVFEQGDFINNLNESNYGIYFDTLKNIENNDLKPSDILIDTKSVENEENVVRFEEAPKEFDMKIYRYIETLDSNLKNLNYYSINKDNNLIKERNEDKINSLLEDI